MADIAKYMGVTKALYGKLNGVNYYNVNKFNSITCPPAATEIYQKQIYSDANLIAYWRLSDTSDSKGSFTLTNNGTVTFGTGKFGNCAQLTTSKYFSMSALNIGGAAARTISAWVYPTELNSSGENDKTRIWQGAYTIFGYGNDSKISACVIYLCAIGAGEIYIAFSWHDFYSAASTVVINTWNHIVVTYAGGNLGLSTIHLYRNGQEVSLTENNQYGTAPANTVNSGYEIGYWTPTYPRYFKGSIDDVAIFNRALSSTEIYQLYNK